MSEGRRQEDDTNGEVPGKGLRGWTLQLELVTGSRCWRPACKKAKDERRKCGVGSEQGTEVGPAFWGTVVMKTIAEVIESNASACES